MNRTVKINIPAILSVLEMENRDLSFLSDGKPYLKKLEEWKKFQNEVKLQRRKLAKKYHPDVSGDSEKMKKINQAVDLLMKISPAPPMPRVHVVYYRVNVYGGWGGMGGSSTTSTSYY